MPFYCKVTNKTTLPEGVLLLSFEDGTVLEFDSEDGFNQWCNQEEINTVLESIKYKMAAAWFQDHGTVSGLEFIPEMTSTDIIKAK